MKNRMTITSFAALFAILVLTGWGCQGPGAPYVAPDSGEVGPDTSGWPRYQNSEWGVSFSYPPNLQYREYRETVEGEEEVLLAFSDQPLPDTLPPEPLFPIMVFRDERTVESAMADYTGALSTEDVTLGSRVVKKIIYYSDILEQNDRVYLVPLRRGFLRVFAPDGTIYATAAENMIANLTETE